MNIISNKNVFLELILNSFTKTIEEKSNPGIFYDIKPLN